MGSVSKGRRFFESTIDCAPLTVLANNGVPGTTEKIGTIIFSITRCIIKILFNEQVH
jgi:hypothetical protein